MSDELDYVADWIGRGIDDFLLEPFNAAMLKVRITACLENANLRQSNGRYVSLSTSPILKNRAVDRIKSEDRAVQLPAPRKNKATQREMGHTERGAARVQARARRCAEAEPRDSPGGKPNLARKTGLQDYAKW